MNNEAIAAALVALPIIVGLLQVLKATFYDLPSGAIPLLALSLGVAYAVGGAYWEPGAVETGDPTMFEQVIAGIILGLSASGFYDVASTTIGNAGK